MQKQGATSSHWALLELSLDAAFLYLFLPFKILASINGNVDVAKILIENGANVNKVDKLKKTSLMVK